MQLLYFRFFNVYQLPVNFLSILYVMVSFFEKTNSYSSNCFLFLIIETLYMCYYKKKQADFAISN